jgi:hypothetical protein
MHATLRAAALLSAGLLLCGLTPATEPFADVRFDSPRAGPGGDALHALGECVREDDAECVDRAFHGGETILRTVRDALDGTLSIERAALVDRYRRQAAAGGRDRYRNVLWRSIEACELSLVSAARGRCDDVGWVDPPPPPLEGLPPESLALFEGLLEDVGEGLGRRRARRVVCGFIRIRDQLTAEEAIVVLADRPGASPAVVDVQCRSLAKPMHGMSETSEGAAEPSMDPDSVGALTAFSQGLSCLERGGGECIQDVAPLPGVLARELMALLAEAPPDGQSAIIDRGRSLAADGRVRAQRVVDLTPRQCRRLARVPDLRLCRASDHTPLPEPMGPPPATVGPQTAAQARAMVALLWGRSLELDARQSTITCPTPIGDLSLDVVWARREQAPPILLDLSCR